MYCSTAPSIATPCLLLLYAYAPPSLFAYSSSMRSTYSFSASISSCVFCVCVALATLCVDLFSTSWAVCAVLEEELVDFSVVEGIGTGIVYGRA